MRGAIVVIQLSESIIIKKCEKSMFIYKKTQQKTLLSGELFVVVIITKGMRVKCTPESDSGVLLYEGGDSCCLSTI